MPCYDVVMDKTTVTVQYEMDIARRGQLTTTVKERTFKTQAAFEKWLDKMAGTVKVLRFEK